MKAHIFSFSSPRQNFSKQGGISRSTKQEQAAPWKRKHQLSFQRGEESKALSLPGIPVSQRSSTNLKRPAESSLNWGAGRGGFSPWEKGLLHSLPLTNPYIFLTERWRYCQCVFSALQTILRFSLSCCSPATGRADFLIYIS